MLYKITVQSVDFEEVEGHAYFSNRKTLFSVYTETSTTKEVELLYNLTDPRAKFVRSVMGRLPDQHYVLIFEKQSATGRMLNKPIFKFFGWSLVYKTLDCLIFENKYMQIGELSPYNLKQRDVQEEVRRKNWRDVPGTLENRDDKTAQDIEPKHNKIISHTGL